MKHNFRTALIALLLAAGITLSAHAELLFAPSAVYDDSFVDVQHTDWFYPHVATLYSMGLTNGKSDTSHFDPASSLTVAEAVTLAARMHSLYELGESETGPDFFRVEGDLWYAPYFAYLHYCGIIGEEFNDHPDLPATRAEVAHILANVLPDELFERINDETVTVCYASGQYIADVNEYTPYFTEILTLYRRGILSGMDSAGSFHPGADIKRSEAAAMLTRIIDPELRVTLHWEVKEELYATSLAALVKSDGSFFTAPQFDDTAAIDADIRYMLSRGERTLDLDYGAPQEEQALREIMDAFLAAIRRYPEQGYNQIHLSYGTVNGKITIRFSSSLYSEDMIPLYRESTFAQAIITRDLLYSNGTLRSDMSQYDKAKAYFFWLCSNCEYDYNCTADSLSHSAYGALSSKLAVCDGYTAAYNLLLLLEGIDCYAIDREDYDHMWTAATLDGVVYHIDTTWGDQSETPIEYYFGMTEEDSFARFQ